LQNTFRAYLQEQKIIMERLKMENKLSHTRNTADCCIIYSTIEKYKQYCRETSILKDKEDNSSTDLVMKQMLAAIGEKNAKYGFNSYFGGTMAVREMPMTKELERYGGISKIIN
jgi:hypothetical protein